MISSSGRISFVYLAAGAASQSELSEARQDPTLQRQLIAEGLHLVALNRDLLLPSGKTFYQELMCQVSKTHRKMVDADKGCGEGCIKQEENHVYNILVNARYHQHTGYVDWSQFHVDTYVANSALTPEELYSILIDFALLVYRAYHPRSEH